MFRAWSVLLGFLVVAGMARADDTRPISVLVWDERQPAQKEAYANFLGNAIAEHLARSKDLRVRSVCLDDPERGLGAAALDATDVLIWWGHVRHREVPAEVGKDIVRRTKDGKLALIALHSAHWSTPFVEAMYERARNDALKALPESARAKAKIVESPTHLFAQPKADEALSPSHTVLYNGPDEDTYTIKLALPNCCFPSYRGDGKASHVRALHPSHPVCVGLPETFDIPRTEMYCEPFHVPFPDEQLFEERWDQGERFRSGSVWEIGRGKVFYFRPGHETYPIFKQPEVLKIIENATRWLGAATRTKSETRSP